MKLLVLVLGMSAGSAYADEWSKSYAVAGSPELRMNTGDGRITVRPGSGNTIQARVHTKGWKIDPSELRIVEQQTGDQVSIEVKFPRMESHHGWGERSVDVELEVPVNTISNLQTGDGGIQIQGLKGNTIARTGDGSIEALDMEGHLDLHTGDGSVTVRGRVNGLNVQTGDGNVEADLAPGSQMGSGWQIHTGDGHVTLHVPSDLGAILDAHTGDGSITVDLPLAIESGALNKSDVRGKINGGGETLQIHTGDGSIRIEKS